RVLRGQRYGHGCLPRLDMRRAPRTPRLWQKCLITIKPAAMLLVNVPASSASKMTSIVKPSSSALTSAGTEDCSNNNAMQTKSSPPDEDDFDDTKSSKRRRRRKKLKDDFELPESLPNVFEFSTSLYRFTEHLAEFTKLYQEVFPQLMADKNKYFISTEQQGVGCLDLLFETFCKHLGMEKLKNLPNGSGERVFCWLGKRKASEILPTLRPNHHIVNRLPMDVFLKDKQSLAFTLQSSIFQRGIGYPEHDCRHNGGRRLRHQLLCPHQYAEHSFQHCQVPGCFEALRLEARAERQLIDLHNGDLCPCFRANYFVPETRVFASSVQQNVFIEEVSRLAPDSQWIVKPSYLRRGRGVRVLPSVKHLKSFLKVETRQRFMWGQDYVVQRYIKNPMLTNAGQKFDVRMFLLVVVCRFWRVLGFLHPGYVRKVARPYKEMRQDDRFDPREHLANTRIWRRANAVVSTPNAPAASGASSQRLKGSSSSISSAVAAVAAPLPESLNSVNDMDDVTSVMNIADSGVTFNRLSAQQASLSTEQVPASLWTQSGFSEWQQQQQQQRQQQAMTLTCPRQQQLNQQLPCAQQSQPFQFQQLLQQRQNSARSRLKTPKKTSKSPEPFEPVPLTGFFRQSFESDECEEFNYAVRHGCLKGNRANLPLLLGTMRIPGARHLAASLPTAKMSAKQQNWSSAKPQSKSKPTAGNKQGKRKQSSVRMRATETRELLEPFIMNKYFIRRLQQMATRICEGVFDQVKEKSNCYQLFSLDICIDSFGDPWLLEVNPTIITEDVNWNSGTIRQVVPAVFSESLGLAHECTRKSLNFLALRTPSSYQRKPNDLVFRQNFLWMYNTPAKSCEMSELKSLKYGVDSMHKQQLASRGIEYVPVDYYPKRNLRRISKKESRQLNDQKKQPKSIAAASAASRCIYRFPSPVRSVPVLEEDLAHSTRYMRLQPDIVGRQLMVRQIEAEARARRKETMARRCATHQDSLAKRSVTVRHRVQAD
ncbi:hypothetical protein BOX15_Mlig030500g2, partial [Macrostomum lignano]